MLPHDLCSKIQNAFRARHLQLPVEHTYQNLGILSILLRNGFITSLTRGTTDEPDPIAFHSVRESQRRIWATLKYRDDQPVLSNMELISLPSRRIYMDVKDLRLIASGRRAKFVKPLGMGEIGIVKTNEPQWLEVREALRLNKGGEIICRAR